MRLASIVGSLMRAHCLGLPEATEVCVEEGEVLEAFRPMVGVRWVWMLGGAESLLGPPEIAVL